MKKLVIKKPLRENKVPGLAGFEPTRTQQSLENETNINAIMARVLKTGQMPTARSAEQPFYGDFTAADDYYSAVNRIADAESEFADLPSAIRSRFENDPGKLIEFLSDSKNLDEAITLGLIEKPIPQQPVGTVPAKSEPVGAPPSGEPARGSQVEPRETGVSGPPASE